MRIWPSCSLSAMVPGPGCERASGGAESPAAKPIQTAMIARGTHLKLLMIISCRLSHTDATPSLGGRTLMWIKLCAGMRSRDGSAGRMLPATSKVHGHAVYPARLCRMSPPRRLCPRSHDFRYPLKTDIRQGDIQAVLRASRRRANRVEFLARQAVDTNPQIRLFTKLKLTICARAGNRAGFFCVRDPTPQRPRAHGGGGRRAVEASLPAGTRGEGLRAAAHNMLEGGSRMSSGGPPVSSRSPFRDPGRHPCGETQPVSGDDGWRHETVQGSQGRIAKDRSTKPRMHFLRRELCSALFAVRRENV